MKAKNVGGVAFRMAMLLDEAPADGHGPLQSEEGTFVFCGTALIRKKE